MKTIGERIKYLRKEVLENTQKDFGLRIGLKPNSVSDIENGKNNPTEQTIKAICREFNINENWLRNGTDEIYNKIDEDFASICAEIGVNDEKAKMAIMKYCQLSDEDKKLFWNFIERFLK